MIKLSQVFQYGRERTQEDIEGEKDSIDQPDDFSSAWRSCSVRETIMVSSLNVSQYQNQMSTSAWQYMLCPKTRAAVLKCATQEFTVHYVSFDCISARTRTQSTRSTARQSNVWLRSGTVAWASHLHPAWNSIYEGNRIVDLSTVLRIWGMKEMVKVFIVEVVWYSVSLWVLWFWYKARGVAQRHLNNT